MTQLKDIASRLKCGNSKMNPIVTVACLASILSIGFTQDTTGWRGLVPLRSTRAQVERLVGVLDIRCQCYSTETETLRVRYAREPCKGDLPGWNVPPDTVLSIEVFPKQPLLFSEMKVRKEDFVETADDTVTTYYGNGKKGLRYSVSQLGLVKSIWYGPSVKDNNMRCAGFPLTDGGITAYVPYDQFQYETVDDVTDRLGEFGVRLLKDLQVKGYVIVYGMSDKKTDAVVKSAKEHLIEELNVDANSLDVISGGYRETSTVELFLIPREWPRPIPTPTRGGIANR